MKDKKDIKIPGYSKTYHCNNCEKPFIKEFEYGQVAEKGKCPFCGVSDRDLNRPRYIQEW
jgi:DNA-directed RNA polymerase subunit RPC12/RpoP